MIFPGERQMPTRETQDLGNRIGGKLALLVRQPISIGECGSGPALRKPPPEKVITRRGLTRVRLAHMPSRASQSPRKLAPLPQDPPRFRRPSKRDLRAQQGPPPAHEERIPEERVGGCVRPRGCARFS